MLEQYSTCPSNCTAALLILMQKFLHSCQLLKNEIKLHYPNRSKVSPYNIMGKLPWLPEPQRGGYLKNNLFSIILQQYFWPNVLSWITVCAPVSMWKHSKLLKLFNNNSTAHGYTKETKKSLILLLYSVYVTLFYKSE